MAIEKERVVFRRIRGRIIPIKVKKGSGIRGGRLRAAENIKQKVGKGLIISGTGLTTAGFVTSRKFFKSFGFPKKIQKKFQLASIDFLFLGKDTATAIKTAKAKKVVSLTRIRKLKEIELKSFKHSFKMAGAIGLKFKVTGRALLIATGLTAAGTGFILSGKGAKQRARESKALNR